MSDNMSPIETAKWQRVLAGQANNRAWALSEAIQRSPEEDEEMLEAAHAAMYFFRFVGDEKNLAHAAQLLAHVYSLLQNGEQASYYNEKSHPAFFGDEAEPWEVALAHAVAANVASCTVDEKAHGEHYAKAVGLIEALSDPEDRDILNATLRVVPVPKDGASHSN